MEWFYLLPGARIAGSSRPGLRREPESAIEQTKALRADLEFLRLHNLNAILSLTSQPLVIPSELANSFSQLHLPVTDMTAPSISQFAQAVAFIDQHQAGVLVHCTAGMGRTGSVLAAWLISQGLSVAQAVAQVRNVCPDAVETDEQMSALEQWSLHGPRAN